MKKFTAYLGKIISAGPGGLVFGLLLLFFSGKAFAIDSPQQFFDYNPYRDPQVLGVFAQEPEGDVEVGTDKESSPSARDQSHKDFNGYQAYIFGSDFTPDQVLYPLKRLQENVAFTFASRDPGRRARMLLSLASERAREMGEMADQGKTTYVTSLAKDYDRIMADNAKTLESFKGKFEATPILLDTDQEVAKHLIALEEILAKVPAQAVPQIDKALTSAERVVDRVSDVVGRPAVPQEMIARLQAYKAQGLLTEEEINKIVGASKRETARDEFRKLAENRVVPLADVKKFDEAAKSYFPSGFAQVVELRKFKEMKDLETQRPDEETVQKIQEFAKNYKSGDIVPSAIRSWWAPMVRLEELQATFRPDLLDAGAYFKYRPEEQQKYTELVERMKPTDKDIKYVREIVARNPQAASDPAYSRIIMLGERFGTTQSSPVRSPVAVSCGREYHWVSVPFMPGGGYCVPDLVYQPLTIGTASGEASCPPNYRRLAAGGACYPENPSGAGVTQYLPAAGSCPSGYHWENDRGTGRGGYCAPDYITGAGGYPSPITPPSYCPKDKVFRDGKCEDYKQAPAEGCPARSWWNGQKCIEQKDCGQGKYQDSNGECKSSAEEFKRYQSQCVDHPIPPGGCGAGWWDMASCSCVGGFQGGGGGRGSCQKPPDCGSFNTYWDQASCQCRSTFDVRPSAYPTSSWDRQATMEDNCKRGGCTWVGRNNACECPSGGGGNYGSPSPESQEASCRAGGGRCVSWVNGACGCERGRSGGGYSGAYSSPTYSGNSYNPEDMCTRGGNCRWENNSCRCESSTQSNVGGPTNYTPSCGSGYYWNGSSCQKSESQNNPQPQPSQPSSPPPPENNPPPAPPPADNPPPAPPPNNPPPAPPPADNPPPAPPPEQSPPPAQ